MEKNKILSKLNINIKDYNNELEKILENKLFSYEVKNLLLSMLYKIENAYKDYETVKVEVQSKKEYIENLLRIIREKCLKISLVKAGTPEAADLEKSNLSYKVDKSNGEIVCFQNELVILKAIFRLDEIDKEYSDLYNYIEKPLNELINSGRLDSGTEVIRDFNGWSWDIVSKEINDIEYNFIYQTMLLLKGKNNSNNKRYRDFDNLVYKMAIQKYISDKRHKEYIKKFEEIKKEKQDRLNLFGNKKEFLDKVTSEKKTYMKKIEELDKILNNHELLRKEYYSRNEKLPNKEKIFSVSYLVKILSEERMNLLDKIEECNKIILPKEFVEQKSRLENENVFLNSIKEKLEKEDIVELAKEFLHKIGESINKINEENKSSLIHWIYKIRYYRFIPINNDKCVKDLKELDLDFQLLFKKIIKKAQELKIWDTFSENQEATYQILKEIFDTKIIYLQNINIQCEYKAGELLVDYYDDTVIESSIKIKINNVRIKKKFKLFI